MSKALNLALSSITLALIVAQWTPFVGQRPLDEHPEGEFPPSGLQALVRGFFLWHHEEKEGKGFYLDFESAYLGPLGWMVDRVLLAYFS